MYKNNTVLVGENFNNYIGVLLKQNKITKIKKINSSNYFFLFINFIYVNIIEPNLALAIVLSLIFIFLLYRYNKKIKKDEKNKKNINKNNEIDPFDNISLISTYDDNYYNNNYNNNYDDYNT